MPLSTHPENTPVAASERMVHIIRMVRRICLLREDGDMLRARRLQEEELLPAVREYRKMQGEEALPDRALDEIFSIETRRVADADALCELLVPRLSSRLSFAGPAGTMTAVPVSRASSPVVAAPAGPPAIPDLLDAMLALDRAGSRREPTARPKF